MIKLNVMTKAERLTNAVNEAVHMEFEDWCLARQAIILELGAIKKKESQETAISKDSNK